MEGAIIWDSKKSNRFDIIFESIIKVVDGDHKFVNIICIQANFTVVLG